MAITAGAFSGASLGAGTSGALFGSVTGAKLRAGFPTAGAFGGIAPSLTGGGALGGGAAAAGDILGKIAGILPIAKRIGAAALGTGQLIGGAVARRKARGLEPEAVDPQLERFRAEVTRRRKAFQTGVVATPFLRPIRQAQAAATTGAIRTGAGLRGISRAQRLAQGQISQLLARLQTEAVPRLLETERQLTQQRAQRILDLQRVRQSKQEALAVRRLQSGARNILGAIA